MSQYIMFEVMEGAYDISCPDRDCPTQGMLSLHQMERLTTRDMSALLEHLLGNKNACIAFVVVVVVFCSLSVFRIQILIRFAVEGLLDPDTCIWNTNPDPVFLNNNSTVKMFYHATIIFILQMSITGSQCMVYLAIGCF